MDVECGISKAFVSILPVRFHLWRLIDLFDVYLDRLPVILALFASRPRRRMIVPNHTHNGQDHTKCDMNVQAFSSEEDEPQGEHKDRLHVAQNLKCDGCEPSNAYELAQVGSNCNHARQCYEELEGVWMRRKYQPSVHPPIVKQ